MAPRHRRSRRHARAYQDHADGNLAAHSRSQGRPRAGNVAGDLPDRASRAPAPARDRAAVCRLEGLKAKPAAERSAAGLLDQAWRDGCRRPLNPQFFLISTSLVSGRKKKPTTAVIDAK